ncbi:MAG: sulfurtransferase TusA family protein [Firmicutes bacterium]|nr:sulfurtransferase TusA family protein [Alicyclobacillaceae bacterium]MCL6496538.1 sulfurtransferase TusA family protein [Bacillota bacterium]
METALVVDAKGLRCPLPIIKAKKGVESVAVGQVVEVQCTDPGSVADFQAWAKSTGHVLVDRREEDGVYIFWIQRSR